MAASDLDPRPTWWTFAWRVVALHVLTYFVVGLASFLLFDYHDLYATTDLRFLMRATDDPWVAFGPAVQPVRGLLFAAVLWPFADRVLGAPRGALAQWGLFLGLAVLGPSVAAAGSLEGLVYTTVPWGVQLIGLPEVIVQTGLFSAGLVGWFRRPARWMDVVAGIGVALVVLMGTAGFLAGTAARP